MTLAVGVRKMCPYCGPGVGVEVLESVSGGRWQRCANCGHVWIQPKGPDAFAAIVDHLHLRPVSPPEEDRPGSVRRALRFQVRLPLQFRVTGEPTWKTGHTENLSRSGMLIRTSEGSWLWTHYLNPGARPPMEVISGCRRRPKVNRNERFTVTARSSARSRPLGQSSQEVSVLQSGTTGSADRRHHVRQPAPGRTSLLSSHESPSSGTAEASLNWGRRRFRQTGIECVFDLEGPTCTRERT